VGIGSAFSLANSPSARLDVDGGLRVRGLTTAGLVVTDANGNLSSSTSLPAGVTGDNLGNHLATQALNLAGNALTGTGASIGSTVGLGVRADGGLNIGQNTSNNVALGYEAGVAITPSGTLTGARNTLTGVRSGRDLTTGGANTFSGYESGRETDTGSFNTFVGHQSGVVNTSGANNTFTGNQSGLANTTGDTNTFTGVQSGRNTTTGSNNTFVGYQAGRINETGSDNTVLGTNSGPATGSIALSNATAVGANVSLTQSNAVILGNNASVGIGTSTPGARLDVNGSIWSRSTVRVDANDTNTGGLSNNAALYFGSGLSPSLEGIASKRTSGGNQYGLDFYTANNIRLSVSNAGNVGIGTPAPAQKLDVVGNVRVGTATTPGKVLSAPTGTSNLLAAAYGQGGNNSTSVFGDSGNFTLAVAGPGVYTITFAAASGLSNVDFDQAAVTASLYGPTPGVVTVSGGIGTIIIRTFNMAGSPTANSYFNFTAFVR
jgi:hypothetical protein